MSFYIFAALIIARWYSLCRVGAFGWYTYSLCWSIRPWWQAPKPFIWTVCNAILRLFCLISSFSSPFTHLDSCPTHRMTRKRCVTVVDCDSLCARNCARVYDKKAGSHFQFFSPRGMALGPNVSRGTCVQHATRNFNVTMQRTIPYLKRCVWLKV